jgi:hypothetical protein
VLTHAGQVIAEVARTTTKPIARFKVRKPQEPRQVTGRQNGPAQQEETTAALTASAQGQAV